MSLGVKSYWKTDYSKKQILKAKVETFVRINFHECYKMKYFGEQSFGNLTKIAEVSFFKVLEYCYENVPYFDYYFIQYVSKQMSFFMESSKIQLKAFVKTIWSKRHFPLSNFVTWVNFYI